jgi:hypothetical protein
MDRFGRVGKRLFTEKGAAGDIAMNTTSAPGML